MSNQTANKPTFEVLIQRPSGNWQTTGYTQDIESAFAPGSKAIFRNVKTGDLRDRSGNPILSK